MPCYVIGSLFNLKTFYRNDNVFVVLYYGREGNLLITESKQGSRALSYFFASLLLWGLIMQIFWTPHDSVVQFGKLMFAVLENTSPLRTSEGLV